MFAQALIVEKSSHHSQLHPNVDSPAPQEALAVQPDGPYHHVSIIYSKVTMDSASDSILVQPPPSPPPPPIPRCRTRAPSQMAQPEHDNPSTDINSMWLKFRKLCDPPSPTGFKYERSQTHQDPLSHSCPHPPTFPSDRKHY